MKSSVSILLLSTIMLTGCLGESTPGSSSEPSVASPTTEAGIASPKLYVFDCGRIQLDSLELFSIPEGDTDVRELIVPCYMIEHQDGRFLWDGGLASSIADVEGWQNIDGFNMRLDNTLAGQLARMNLDLSAFDFMAFSHMHFDHVGVANELENATLIIQQAEYDAAFADPVTVQFFDQSLYDNLKNAKHLMIDGDHDVFGDGTVRIISAPGHTPGHQVLYVDLAETGPIVLSGDLYHFRVSREKRYVPQFNFDAELTRTSMERVEAFLAETNAALWIEHDLAWFEQLEKAPKYYE